MKEHCPDCDNGTGYAIRDRAPNKVILAHDLPFYFDYLLSEKKVTPQGLANFSAIAEALVLHEGLVAGGLAFTDDRKRQFQYQDDGFVGHNELRRVLEGGVLDWQLSEAFDRELNNRAGGALVRWACDSDSHEQAFHKDTFKDIPDNIPRGSREFMQAVRNKFRTIYESISEDFGLSFYHAIDAPNAGVLRSNPQGLNELLYEALAKIHNVKVEKVHRFTGIRAIYIPPVLSIVLGRASNSADIPNRIVELRNELAPFREKCTTLQKQVALESSLAAQLDVLEELENVQSQLVRISERKRTRFVRSAWEIVKGGNPIKMATTALDEAIKYVEQRTTVHRWQAYFNLWDEVTNAPSQAALVERVFGKPMIDGTK